MRRLNYHHLHYFLVAAEEGSLSGAATRLGVGLSTVSNQVHALEEELGVELFTRAGRSVALTAMGRMVKRRATEIFALGDDLVDTLGRGSGLDERKRVVIGVGQDVPKLIAWRVLEPLFQEDSGVYPVVHQDAAARLAPALAGGVVDVTLTDGPLSLSGDRHLRHHVVATSPIHLMAAPALARSLAPGFPGSLEGAPFLLPAVGASLRRLVEAWLDAQGLHVHVVGEFADSGLLKTAARAGAGVLPVPGRVEEDVIAQFDLHRVGVVPHAVLDYHLTVTAGHERDEAVRRIDEACQTLHD